MGVNLLPAHIVEETSFAKKRPVYLLAAALLAAAVVPPYLALQSRLKADNDFAAKFTDGTPALVQRAELLKEEDAQAKKLAAKIAGLEGLAKSKSNWIELFIDLEKRLMEQKDVWLEKLHVVRSSEGNVQKYNLELTGRLLIRDFNPDDPTAYDHNKAIQRVNDLLKSFERSAFIKKCENVRTDPTDPRILKFDFTLVVDPSKPI